jgi:hypothetical protein
VTVPGTGRVRSANPALQANHVAVDSVYGLR